MKKLLSIILAILMIVTTIPFALAADGDTVILYTNDIHCAVDDYAVLSAYKAQLETEGSSVVLVDAGDAIQGEIIGLLTEGAAIVDIMNAVGYDYAVPGNHEFDYGMNEFLDLAQNKAQYEYISSNFYDLTSVSPVLTPYAIEDFGAYQVAFVGISTPETITKSTPEFFMDEGGNYIYGFPVYPGGMTNEDLYDSVQESVDDAIENGADIVVAVGHTGELETTDGWKTSDIIANTSGIDYFIDAHSHETVVEEVYLNVNGEDVIRTSTGTKLANFGVLTISGDTADFELVNPDGVDVEAMSEEAKAAYNTVKAKVDGYNKEIAQLLEKIGTSEVKLVTYDEDNSWAVRKRETNAGDFVADAYRAVTGADVAVANGGGVRGEIEIGDVSRKMLMDMNPFGNYMCIIEVTGQQLIDVLEHGARNCPESLGGFFQVSGVTFEIHTYNESPVSCDKLGNFIDINDTMPRRVQNVYVGDEPVDLNKTYTLAGSQYVLTQGGDGLTMLDGAKVVQDDGLLRDYEMIIKYFTETLEGKITEEQYGNPDGDGRISIIDEPQNASDYDYEIEYGDTLTITTESPDGVFVKFIPEKSGKYIFRTESDGIDTAAYLYDSNGEELFGDYKDDTEESNDFILKYEFEAGKVYYLNVFVYNGESASFDLVSECGHNFEDGSCLMCGKICTHDEIDFLGYCPCGEVFLGTDIKDGDEFDIENEDASDIFWFRYIPEISGFASFKSVSENTDPDCSLYDSEGEWLTDSTDENDLDFDLVYYFEAGETYYFSTFNWYPQSAFSVTLNRLSHTSDEGIEHELDFVEGTYPNCTEYGYTDGLYCNECKEFFYGHKELPLDAEYHIDDNSDEICDLCGKKTTEDEEECSHICHSDNWFLNIIWKIVRFFTSIFRIKPYCECGAAHY